MAGTECRAEVEKELKITIEQEWATILQHFRKEVEATIQKTKIIAEYGWDEMIKCEQDHPCCEVSEVVWKNLQTQITETTSLINQKKTVWEDLERRRIEMETDCPDVDFSQWQIQVTVRLPPLRPLALLLQSPWTTVLSAKPQVPHPS